MKNKTSFSQTHKALVRRYLLWAYKTTKESFERIERKTTQLMVDEYIAKRASSEEFKAYIKAKRADELKLKFSDAQGKILHPQYVYLKNRLAAIEAAIRHFLGPHQLRIIQALYEKEMTRRILEARDH